VHFISVSETDQEEDEENKGLKVWILVCVPVVIAVLLGSVIGVICFIRHRRYFRRKPNSSVEISLTELCKYRVYAEYVHILFIV